MLGKKKQFRVQATALIASAFLCTNAIGAPQTAPQATVQVAKPGTERHERNVDRAALSSQKKAIGKISRLIKKYRGTRREPILLARLAEIYKQNASIHFRIAFATTNNKKKRRNEKKYKQSLKDTIYTINKLLKKYPDYEQREIVYFMRGKSHEELEQRKSASRDYLYLVRNFPNARETISAYMSLANFAIDDNRHREAIKYLRQVEKRPDTPHYSFALFKLAWSYYNLPDFKKAISYLERHVKYFDKKSAAENGLTPSDHAIRANSLSDIALFYHNGYEKYPSRYPIKKALSYYRSIAGENKSGLGKMAIRTSKLLRSRNQHKELIAWKNQLIREEAALPETLEVILITFEHQYNKQDYQAIVLTSKDMVTVYKANPRGVEKSEFYERAQRMLLDTAKSVRKTALKYQKHKGVGKLSKILVGLYLSFTQMVRGNDPRIQGVHYNLAETLFKLRQYKQATHHYNWVVKNWTSKSKIKREDVFLKAISSRYQELRAAKIIPKTLVAKKIPKDQEEIKIEPRLLEMVKWIDKYAKTFRKPNDNLTNLFFEANRALYKQGKIDIALKRMIKFARAYPKSKYAVPSASLVIDTYVASNDWEKTHEAAKELREIKAWKKSKFGKKLFKIAADARYKQIEIARDAGDSDKALDRIEDFIDDYGNSKRLEDILFMAGKTALEQEKRPLALKYYSSLIEKFPRSSNAASALIARAQLAEEQFLFEEAAKDYRKYLNIKLKLSKKKSASKEQLNSLRKKTLFLTWMANDLKQLDRDLRAKQLCSPELKLKCDEYRALVTFLTNRHPQAKRGNQLATYSIKRAMKGALENRPLWAAVALRNQQKLRFPDRALLVRIVTKGWKRLDPSVQYSLLPDLSEAIPTAFRLNRKSIRKYARLRANEKSINHRVRLIKEMEETAATVDRLPWSRIIAEVTNEIAKLYLDFSHELSTIPAPQNLGDAEIAAYQETIRQLVLPFEDKGQELRRKSFEIASDSGVNQKTFLTIANVFFKDNPSQAQRLKGEVTYKKTRPVDLALLKDWDPKGDWDDAIDESPTYLDDPDLFLKSQWVRALKRKKWAQVAFFVNEIKGRKLISGPVASMVNAVSLSASGAQAESLYEIERIRKSLDKEKRIEATIMLVGHYVSTFSQKRTKTFIEILENEAEDNEIMESIDNDDEAFLVAYGAQWSQAKISDKNWMDVLEEATGASDKTHRAWAKKVLLDLKKAKEKPKAKKIASR